MILSAKFAVLTQLLFKTINAAPQLVDLALAREPHLLQQLIEVALDLLLGLLLGSGVVATQGTADFIDQA